MVTREEYLGVSYIYLIYNVLYIICGVCFAPFHVVRPYRAACRLLPLLWRGGKLT